MDVYLGQRSPCVSKSLKQEPRSFPRWVFAFLRRMSWCSSGLELYGLANRRFESRPATSLTVQVQATPNLSSDASLLACEVHNFPLTIEADRAISVPIRFAPAALEPASAIMTSDDRSSPATIAISGLAPPGKLTVTGSGEMLPARAAAYRHLQCW